MGVGVGVWVWVWVWVFVRVCVGVCVVHVFVRDWDGRIQVGLFQSFSILSDYTVSEINV